MLTKAITVSTKGEKATFSIKLSDIFAPTVADISTSR